MYQFLQKSVRFLKKMIMGGLKMYDIETRIIVKQRNI